MIRNDIRNDAHKASDELRLELTRNVLQSALAMVDHKLADEEPALIEEWDAKRRTREKAAKVVSLVFAVAALGSMVAALLQAFSEAKAVKQEEAKEEQKDLYRRMSAVKGR